VKIFAERDRPVTVGHRVWLGEGVQIAPGSVIGDDAVICAGIRVDGDIPARAILAGNPPRVARMAR
jgi:maltose O-acetyltransferase